jgi:hypothetical protein
MSNLLKKSRDNHTASGILIDNGLHSTSVHCSYYRCVQHMLHIINEHFADERQDWSAGSHNYLIKRVGSALKERDDRKATSFNNDIQRLKKLRVKADYEPVLMDGYSSREAQRLSEGIVNTFNQLLK